MYPTLLNRQAINCPYFHILIGTDYIETPSVPVCKYVLLAHMDNYQSVHLFKHLALLHTPIQTGPGRYHSQVTHLPTPLFLIRQNRKASYHTRHNVLFQDTPPSSHILKYLGPPRRKAPPIQRPPSYLKSLYPFVEELSELRTHLFSNTFIYNTTIFNAYTLSYYKGYM